MKVMYIYQIQNYFWLLKFIQQLIPRLKYSIKIHFERQSNYNTRQEKKEEEKSDRGSQGTASTETSKVTENRTLTKQDRNKKSFTLQSSISKKQLTF